MKLPPIEETLSRLSELAKVSSADVDMDAFEFPFLFANQCHYVTDFSKRMVIANQGVQNLLGYNNQEFTFELIFSPELIHPEDYVSLMTHGYEMVNYIGSSDLNVQDYCGRFIYRIKHRKGHYLVVLRQTYSLYHNANQQPQIVLSCLTDITHMTQFFRADMDFYCTHPSALSFRKHLKTLQPSMLSAREKEVLYLVIEGKKSTEIASALGLSVHTIYVLRKRILKKTNTNNTQSASKYALKMGWI